MTSNEITYYCYILSNKVKKVIYIGCLEGLKNRIAQRKNGKGAVFTKKYSAFDFKYFETCTTKKEAKNRERQLKNWHKEWKWNLIKEFNPNLKTLKDY